MTLDALLRNATTHATPSTCHVPPSHQLTHPNGLPQPPGSVATNMSDTYLNYAYALEWLNFQVDLTGKSSGTLDPASANAAAAITGNRDGTVYALGLASRRRLTSVAGVLNAYNTAEQVRRAILVPEVACINTALHAHAPGLVQSCMDIHLLPSMMKCGYAKHRAATSAPGTRTQQYGVTWHQASINHDQPLNMIRHLYHPLHMSLMWCIHLVFKGMGGDLHPDLGHSQRAAAGCSSSLSSAGGRALGPPVCMAEGQLPQEQEAAGVVGVPEAGGDVLECVTCGCHPGICHVAGR